MRGCIVWESYAGVATTVICGCHAVGLTHPPTHELGVLICLWSCSGILCSEPNSNFLLSLGRHGLRVCGRYSWSSWTHTAVVVVADAMQHE
jgi:hypothetical protein